MDRRSAPRPLFGHRIPLLAVALLALLLALASTPTHAQNNTLTRGAWQRVQLSQSRLSSSYTFSTTISARLSVVSLSSEVRIAISTTGTGCSAPGNARKFFNIRCGDANGTYTIMVSLGSDYSGDAISAYVRYDDDRDVSYEPITLSGGTVDFTVSANSIKIFRYNYGGGPSRHCLTLGRTDGVRHTLTKVNGSLVSYTLPDDAVKDERPSYRLESGDTPHYLIIANTSNSGIATSVKVFSRSGTTTC